MKNSFMHRESGNLFSITNNALPVIFLTLTILFSACSFIENSNVPKETPSQSPETPLPTQSAAPTSTTPPSPIVTEPADEIEAMLESLTIEEKIGQLFFIASRYNAEGQKQLSMDDNLTAILKKFKPGGFILFAENLDSISQTSTFIKDLQKSSDIPLFVGIDEEGGIVTRLNKADKLHSTVMPDPYTIWQTNDTEYAFKASKAIAEEIKSLGFNMNFAPVADVFSNPENRIIGKRAYGSDAKLAASMVSEAVKGAKEGGVIPVLKHFPGHGDTLQDSHTTAAVVENDLERLRKVEFLPFKAGLESGAEVVMTAHVLTPKITQNGLPATLSEPVLQGILRDELGFEGLIVTDGLEMSAISEFYPEEEAVVLAIEAGVDMLLLPKNLEASYNAILKAVKDGRLTEDRIDESVRRILKIKSENIFSNQNQTQDPEEVLGSKQHKDLAEEIVKKSMKQ